MLNVQQQNCGEFATNFFGMASRGILNFGKFGRLYRLGITNCKENFSSPRL